MDKRIYSLSEAQAARMPEFVEKWTRIALCTDPADRETAERGIAAAYKVAGLAPPKIAWCSSPLSMVLTRAIAVDKLGGAGIDKKVRNSVWGSVWANARNSVRARVRNSVGDSTWDLVRARVGGSVEAGAGGSVWNNVWDSVEARVRNSVWARVRNSVGGSAYGQHDARWLASYDFFAEGMELRSETKDLSGISDIAKSAGWWFPCEKICWVSERTSEIHWDENRRLHCTTGPAVAYPDGFGVWSWHGTTVPREWIESPEKITPKIALTHENIEERRAACEILGWERILKELKASVIDRDADPEIGELVEVEIPDIGKEKFLRVTCGTGRRFALPVPPDMTTALQANAWTYNIPEDLLKLKEFRT